MRAALGAVRKLQPKALVLAVPLAASSTLDELANEVDEIVCLERHDTLGAIGDYYADFAQVTDSEVRRLLVAATPD